MTETTSGSLWLNRVSSGMALLTFLASSAAATCPATNVAPSLLRGRITNSSTVSRSEHLPGEVKSWQEIRTAKVRALRGKYCSMLTHSEEFAKQKNSEISLEGF